MPRDESGQRFFDPKTKERIRLLVHLRQAGLSDGRDEKLPESFTRSRL
nr:hypothetical protein [Oenococcus oeni]